MRFSFFFVLAFSATLLVGGVSGATIIVGPTQGYVQYRVILSNQTSPVEIFTVNESATPTAQNGLVLLTANLVSNHRNLTYSRTLNASSFPEIFPYLLGLNNQSFAYHASGIAITVHIASTGNVVVTFNGNHYQGTTYHVSASATYPATLGAISANGTIVTMPSGLIYSIELQPVHTYSVQVQLEQTNLPLVDPSNSSGLPVGVVLVSLGLLGAAAFAVPSAFKRLRKRPEAQPNESRESEPEEKPSYWVD